jgi:hypothetical protein
MLMATADTTSATASVDDRDRRALKEAMTVVGFGPAMFEVYTAGSNVYRVDLRDGRCTCDDHRYRGETCKHIRRVLYAVGGRDSRLGVDVDPVLAKRPAVEEVEN